MMSEQLASTVPEEGRYTDVQRLLKQVRSSKRLQTLIESDGICLRLFSMYANEDNLAQSALPMLSLILALLAYRTEDIQHIPDFLARSPIGDTVTGIVDRGEAMVFLASHDIMVQFLRMALGIKWTEYQDGRTMIVPNSASNNMQITLELGIGSRCRKRSNTARGKQSCFMVRAWTFLPSAEQYPNLQGGSNSLKRRYVPMFGSNKVTMPWSEFRIRLASYILEQASSASGYLPDHADEFLKIFTDGYNI